MSIRINLVDSNNNTKTVLVPAGTTFRQIIERDDVDELFPNDVAADAVISCADTDISDGGRLADIVLDAEAQNNDTIVFDAEFDMDEEEVAEDLGVDQSAPAGSDTVSSAVGHVIVLISGGIISVKLAITPNMSTVADALSNAAVLARSGMSAAELADATVKYRGEILSTADSRRTTRLQDGTVIEVNARTASTKG
jgi:hypothetical protein